MHCDITEITCHSSGGIRDMVAAGRLRDEVAAALAIAWAQVREREDRSTSSPTASLPGRPKSSDSPISGSTQEALDEALHREWGQEAKVAVLTHAPDMLPIIRRSE